jgi:hypothetical protein
MSIKDCIYEYTDNAIWCGDIPVMHREETKLMQDYAALVTRNGGNILEVGFGMGISADAIVSQDIKSYTIIEKNIHHYNKALEWAEDKPNATVFLGDWIDVIPTITKKFDGIFHDTFEDDNYEKFLDVCKPIAKEKCLLSMFYFGINNNLRGNSNYITVEHSDEAKSYMQIQHLPDKMIYTTLINNKWSANSIDPVNHFSPINSKKI